MIRIRKMQEEDLEQVSALEEMIFSQPWSKKGFQDSIYLKNTCYLVAEIETEIVGYCGAYFQCDEAEITNVAVKKSMRNQKIGFTMLEFLFEQGKTNGIKQYFLEVRVSNKSGIQLYKNIGFVEIGKRKNFYEKPVEDALLMCKS